MKDKFLDDNDEILCGSIERRVMKREVKSYLHVRGETTRKRKERKILANIVIIWRDFF